VTPRVLYCGTYDQGPGRNAILQAGLRAVGVEVGECHATVWADTEAKLAALRRPGAALRAGLRLVSAWRALAGCHRAAGPHEVLLVGATGHADLPFARRLARRSGQLLVFDPLVSATETARDRALAAPGSWRLAALGPAERRLFALPDLTLVDTAAHGAALAEEVGLDPARSAVVPVGAPAVYRTPSDYRPRADGPLEVLYFGQFIPLHGLDTVVAAAARLAGRSDLRFTLVGVGQALEAVRRQVADLGLSRLRLVPTWLPAERLVAEHLAGADLVLGIFGGQPKAARVVPYKVYAGLAAGRAVLTADTPAVRELLSPGDEVWTVPPADPAALAAALARLAEDPALRARLAATGRVAYDARFSPPVLGARLRQVLVEALAERLGRPPAGQ
jgi:glycosyltransferase involved in cell wall biosynthesis